MLRRVANADSEEELQKSIEDLKCSDVWGNANHNKFRQWLSKTWLPARKVIFKKHFYILRHKFIYLWIYIFIYFPLRDG